MKESKEGKNSSDSTSLISDFAGDLITEGAIKSILSVGEIVIDTVQNNGVASFLKEKFNIAGDVAVEVATKLPQAVIEKIETFDGEGLSNIASAIADTVKSMELPDIDFPDIDV